MSISKEQWEALKGTKAVIRHKKSGKLYHIIKGNWNHDIKSVLTGFVNWAVCPDNFELVNTEPAKPIRWI